MGKNRIKTAGAVFIAVMVCFTFASRAAQSVTTAVAETKKAVSGKITHEISASGKVEAGSEFSVLVPESLRIEEICAEPGDTVKAGDVLFVTAGNRGLERAEEDFLSWERKSSMKLNGLAEAYLLAYEDWQRYLEKTKGWYWKAEDDQKEDELELAVRDREYEYFKCCKTYFTNYGVEEKIRIGALDGQLENAEKNTAKSQTKCQKLQREMNTAKNEYWEYKRSRERTYQFVRKDEEKKFREALEKAVTEYQNELEEYEGNLISKVRAVEDAVSECVDESGNVVSMVSGMVKEVNIKEGAVTPSSASMVIAVSSGKKQVRVQIGADMESCLAVGDACVLKKYGSTEEIRGQKITDIEYDEKDDSLLDVTVEISDDTLSAGDMVTVNISKQSEQYPFVVPLDAVHIGGGETYVLAVKEQEGILGTVSEAEKIIVRILEQNSDYAAVSSDGISDREIIVRTDREVGTGGRIRKKVS